MENFKKFIIKSEPFNTELLSGILWELDILGIEEEDDFISVYCKQESQLTKEKVASTLSKLKKENLLEAFQIAEEEVENKNWNEEWEKKQEIIKIPPRIVIRPSFKEYSPADDETVIIINPKMSFGTGRHETTRLMLELLQKYTRPDDEVLDVGSGTGILGIAAAKMGAGRVLAIDNDEWCYINGVENAKINGVSEKVVIQHSEIASVSNQKFDLVLANINKNILLSIQKELARTVKDNTGRLILSGILNSDEKELIATFENLSFNLLETKRLNEWSALVFEKRN